MTRTLKVAVGWYFKIDSMEQLISIGPGLSIRKGSVHWMENSGLDWISSMRYVKFISTGLSRFVIIQFFHVFFSDNIFRFVRTGHSNGRL